MYFSFIKALRGTCLQWIWPKVSPLLKPDFYDFFFLLWRFLTIVNSPGSDGFKHTKLGCETAGSVSVCVSEMKGMYKFLNVDSYLPVLAVLQPVADLILGLKQEVFESRWGLPANTELVLQLANATDRHT